MAELIKLLFPSMTISEISNQITFLKLQRRDLLPYIEDLGKLRIEVFREFPYLYEGDFEYENKYLRRYANSERSLVVIALNGKEIIGATTCIPLADEEIDFQKPFLENSFEINQIFYFGESIIKKQFRGMGIGHRFFEFREEHAQKMTSDLRYTGFCAVNRENHPSKPSGYKPLDSFWNRMGYLRQDHLKISLPWKDIGEDMETRKSLTFYLKDWSITSGNS